MATKRLTIKREIPPITIELPEFFSILRSIAANGKSDWVANEWSRDWNGNKTVAESVECLEAGWMDAPAIANVSIPHAPSFLPDVDYNYDVTGNFLDVATYLTGIPEHWFAAEEVNRPTDNICRLSIGLGGSWKVSPQQLTNRGQAIIALVNSLELSGLSVELVLVDAWVSVAGIKNTLVLPIKKAGQPLDMNRLQFMLICPAFYRRCILGYEEFVQGKSLYTCNTFSLDYPLPGYTHIPHWAGLSDTARESMDWAQAFGQEVVKTPALV